ncbi:MAG TPA: DUF4367 domain-containing protein [Anaerolineales bacterium]|nr:DUF4367 domain-containing protein [Anaerolineales bacterium]
MNEDFMRQFQKMPDSMLLEKIHVRLERKERKRRIKQYLTHSVMTLIFAFGVLLIFSSAVRAKALQTVEHAQVMVCKKLKIPCSGAEGALRPEPGLDVPLEYLSLHEAQARFMPPNALPTYVPQGFERLADVEFFDLPNQPTLVVAWKRPNHYSLIKLLVSHNSFEIKEYAESLGHGGIEETLFDGKPALIVRGRWNIGIREDGFAMTNALMWRYDENTVYALMSLEGAVPLDELLKMAESIP